MTDSPNTIITGYGDTIHLNDWEGGWTGDIRANLIEGITEASRIRNDDAAWTWLDDDPSVAWEDTEAETYHGKLRSLYLSNGWEACYHREGARFHYDVKVNGPGRYRGFHDRLREVEAKRPLLDVNELTDIAQSLEDNDLEMWWEDLGGYVHYDLKSKGVDVWSCGRSGGYVNVPDLETDPIAFVRLGYWLGWQRDAWNSYDAGRYHLDYALEVYDERKLESLASPREALTL